MAILKHIASKNADYGEAERYLIFQHDEYTQKPILDENGHMLIREEYYLDGINCDPFTFAAECQETNAYFHKNQSYNDIKSHHYIISFDPKDRDEHGLTGELAQQLGVEYAKENFPGHQALVCTHTDGHNGSGNIHVHIVINSIRKYDTKPQPYMEFDRDSKAGYKHHLSDRYRIYLKQKVMDMCTANGLNQVDLLTPAERKISEKEYWAKRRGQKKLDKHNAQLEKKGLTPRQTTFQTEKQYLRDAIDTVASQAISQEDFSRLLSEKYNITFKVRRGRYSYLHPNRSKYITGRSLGTLYEEKHLLQIFQENSTSQITENPVPDISQVVNSSTPAVSAYTATTTEAPHTFLFIKSDLRLVTDLQHCIKAQQSQAYAQKVKLSNLKMMAQTVAYVQEHGFQSKADLDAALSDASAQSTDARNTLKSTENTLKNVNEQIHYTGQYLANKSIYSDYRKSRNKEKFYDDHRAELTLYESALRILKEKSQGNKLPTLKMLREEKNRLTELQTMQREDFNARREHERELRTVCSNVDIILGTSQVQNRQHEHTQEKS
ncbi:relaxase/mobilization nuclease domain-containing protein [Mediterraneibacter gnavus]|uniref:relaxase/mobilization nuclease domain-containing protein n=1 Tax=Mediterraneibacter gnavus TaxID=33038 RepID=UPI000E43810B|nr:relaxase/mobilization nuclease domain-containing protein [Mediterraneibacter gnavus]RGK06278.1 rlx protein [Mediterraneibacter gnavus]